MVPHAIIVDFAVALLVISVGFDLLAALVDDRDLRVVSWWTLQIGTLSAALAVVSGLAAADAGVDAPRVTDTIVLHRNSGFVTLACFSACALWRARRPGFFPERFRDAYWLLATVGFGALVVTAYWGGILVFRLGVGVITTG